MSLEDERDRIMSMLTQLERRIDGHEGKLKALSTVPAALESIDRKLWVGEQTIRAMQDGLAANTAITKSIHEAQIAGRVVQGVGKWIGALILGAAALWAAFKGLRA